MPAEVLLQRVDLPGEPPTTVAIARDVRERQEVQGRLRRLAEAEHARAAELNAVIRAMGDGVIVCGADGRTILANPAGRQMFPEGAETSYASILAQLHDPDGDAPRLGTHAGPVVLRTRSEPERWIEVATYPVADRTTDGEPGWRDDPRPSRRHRAAAARGRPRDVHRCPVARAADADHHDLRWRSRALARGQRSG